MEPIKAEFLLVKVEESVWDIAIFSEDNVLKSFQKVYPTVHFIEKSVFEKKPAIIVPDFPNKNHASIWKQYWVDAFADPDNACKSCPTVQHFFSLVEQFRKAGKE